MSDISVLTYKTPYMTNDDDLTLAVSGSLPQLGNWDERRALEANEDPRYSGLWLAGATFAPGEHMLWQWILLSKSKKEILGEDILRKFNVPFYSEEERLSNERGRLERLSLRKRFSFDINFNLLQNGGILFVVGSIPELGLWKPEKGLQVTQSLDRDDMWIAKFECSNKITVLHWKLIHVNSETSEIQWEGHIYRAVTIEAIGGADNFIAQKDVVPGQQDYVSIQAHLECETTNDVQSLVIVGSIPELRNWNPLQGLQAIQISPNSGTWYVKINCPVNELKQVRFGYDKSVEWETRPAHKILIKEVGGRLETRSNGKTTLRPKKAPRFNSVDSESIRFSLKIYGTPLDNEETLAITGSIPELGSWDPKMALKAHRWRKGTFDWWAEFKCRQGVTFQWKMLVLDSSGEAVRTETHPMRIIDGRFGGRITAKWSSWNHFNPVTGDAFFYGKHHYDSLTNIVELYATVKAKQDAARIEKERQRERPRHHPSPRLQTQIETSSEKEYNSNEFSSYKESQVIKRLIRERKPYSSTAVRRSSVNIHMRNRIDLGSDTVSGQGDEADPKSKQTYAPRIKPLPKLVHTCRPRYQPRIPGSHSQLRIDLHENTATDAPLKHSATCSYTKSANLRNVMAQSKGVGETRRRKPSSRLQIQMEAESDEECEVCVPSKKYSEVKRKRKRTKFPSMSTIRQSSLCAYMRERKDLSISDESEAERDSATTSSESPIQNRDDGKIANKSKYKTTVTNPSVHALCLAEKCAMSRLKKTKCLTKRMARGLRALMIRDKKHKRAVARLQATSVASTDDKSHPDKPKWHHPYVGLLPTKKDSVSVDKSTEDSSLPRTSVVKKRQSLIWFSESSSDEYFSAEEELRPAIQNAESSLPAFSTNEKLDIAPDISVSKTTSLIRVKPTAVKKQPKKIKLETTSLPTAFFREKEERKLIKPFTIYKKPKMITVDPPSLFSLSAVGKSTLPMSLTNSPLNSASVKTKQATMSQIDAQPTSPLSDLHEGVHHNRLSSNQIGHGICHRIQWVNRQDATYSPLKTSISCDLTSNVNTGLSQGPHVSPRIIRSEAAAQACEPSELRKRLTSITKQSSLTQLDAPTSSSLAQVREPSSLLNKTQTSVEMNQSPSTAMDLSCASTVSSLADKKIHVSTSAIHINVACTSDKSQHIRMKQQPEMNLDAAPTLYDIEIKASAFNTHVGVPCSSLSVPDVSISGMKKQTRATKFDRPSSVPVISANEKQRPSSEAPVRLTLAKKYAKRIKLNAYSPSPLLASFSNENHVTVPKSEAHVRDPISIQKNQTQVVSPKQKKDSTPLVRLNEISPPASLVDLISRVKKQALLSPMKTSTSIPTKDKRYSTSTHRFIVPSLSLYEPISVKKQDKSSLNADYDPRWMPSRRKSGSFSDLARILLSPFVRTKRNVKKRPTVINLFDHLASLKSKLNQVDRGTSLGRTNIHGGTFKFSPLMTSTPREQTTTPREQTTTPREQTTTPRAQPQQLDKCRCYCKTCIRRMKRLHRRRVKLSRNALRPSTLCDMRTSVKAERTSGPQESLPRSRSATTNKTEDDHKCGDKKTVGFLQVRISNCLQSIRNFFTSC